jgi:hypothetical protein
MVSTARRVIFTYRGGAIRLEAAVEVPILAPPSHAISGPIPRTPFFFDLQDDSGRVLYRRRRTHPASPSFEVPTGDPSRPFENPSTDEVLGGAFSILVPKLSGGVFVEIFGTSDGLIGTPPASLGRFDLRSAPNTFAPPLPPGRGP